MEDYVEVNLAQWNSTMVRHVRGYRIEEFFADPDHLSNVVRYDVLRLGCIQGLDVVHLQCHIDTDTLSLTRLGARSVTGIDFSRPALDAAASLATERGAGVSFVESEVYSAFEAVGSDRFDLVYTGIGALC